MDRVYIDHLGEKEECTSLPHSRISVSVKRREAPATLHRHTHIDIHRTLIDNHRDNIVHP